MRGETKRRVLRTLMVVLALGSALLWAWVWMRARSPIAVVVETASSQALPDPGPRRFLKGQTHAHSFRSGDSETPPADVVRWYEKRGFDFVVFTDHNTVTVAPSSSKILAIPGVELTQNLERCSPPEAGSPCLLHVNALFVDPSKAGSVAAMPTSEQRLDRYAWAIESARTLGGVAQINHPNFYYSADATLLTELGGRGATFLEIANEAVDSNNGGDVTHPSTEALWDAVLTNGRKVWGVASDDAHHYFDAIGTGERGETAHVGDRGFVMVRATKDVSSIRAAMERGDFYSSSGVVLSRVEMSTTSIEVAGKEEALFRLIGDGGRVLDQRTGTEVRFELKDIASRYVRVDVTDANRRKAWLQPVWLR